MYCFFFPSHAWFSFFLFFKGVGVILVTVSGAAWHVTAPGATCLSSFGVATRADLSRFCRDDRHHNHHSGQHQNGIVFPEFRHRPPPPTYQASMHEQRLRVLMMERDRMRVSPPPAYNSTNFGRMINWKNDFMPSWN